MVDGVTRKLTAARECGVHAVPFVPRDIFALVMPLLTLLVWGSSPSSVVGAARCEGGASLSVVKLSTCAHFALSGKKQQFKRICTAR